MATKMESVSEKWLSCITLPSIAIQHFPISAASEAHNKQSFSELKAFYFQKGAFLFPIAMSGLLGKVQFRQNGQNIKYSFFKSHISSSSDLLSPKSCLSLTYKWVHLYHNKLESSFLTTEQEILYCNHFYSISYKNVHAVSLFLKNTVSRNTFPANTGHRSELRKSSQLQIQFFFFQKCHRKNATAAEKLTLLDLKASSSTAKTKRQLFFLISSENLFGWTSPWWRSKTRARWEAMRGKAGKHAVWPPILPPSVVSGQDVCVRFSPGSTWRTIQLHDLFNLVSLTEAASHKAYTNQSSKSLKLKKKKRININYKP